MEKHTLTFHEAGTKEGFVDFGDTPPESTEAVAELLTQHNYRRYSNTEEIDRLLPMRAFNTEGITSIVMVWRDTEGIVYAYRFHPLSDNQEREGFLGTIQHLTVHEDRFYMVKETQPDGAPEEP